MPNYEIEKFMSKKKKLKLKKKKKEMKKKQFKIDLTITSMQEQKFQRLVECWQG